MKFLNYSTGCWHIYFIAVFAFYFKVESGPIDEQLPGSNYISPISQVASSPGNALQGSAALINEFTGQAAFSIPLAGISNHNGLAFGVNLSYYGGSVTAQDDTHAEYSPTSWVGIGFNLRAPFIMADHKGTRDINDDEYSLAFDGMSPMKLVSVAGAPHIFRAITSPGLKVERIVVNGTVRLFENNVPVPGHSSTFLPPIAHANTNPSGEDYFEYQTSYIMHWIVTLPSGVRYIFGDKGDGSNTHCDGPTNEAGMPQGPGNQYELCLPTVGKKIGFQPFYHQGHHAKMAYIWYLRRIQDPVLTEEKGGQFSIWFEYDKIQEWTQNIGNGEPHLGGRFGKFKLDRALYIKRIFSSVGEEFPTNLSKILQEVNFDREPKNQSDLYENSWKNPDALMEKDRLNLVTVKSRGQVLRKFRIIYDQTPSGKTRLKEILEQDGIFGTERPYYRFDYHTTLASRLSKVTDAAGREVVYTFGEVAVESDGFSQDFDLNTLGGGVPGISDFESPNIDYRGSFGDRYYIHVEDKDCADADQERIYEFRRQGTYWAPARVFLAPQGGCGRFNMAPDGSYFIYMFNGSIKVYKLDEHVAGYGPHVYDLMSNPSAYPPAASYTNANMDGFPIEISNNPNLSGEVILFSDWFVYWNRTHAVKSTIATKKSIRFFMRNSDDVWFKCTSIANMNVSFDNRFDNVQSQFRNNCVDYQIPTQGDRLAVSIEVRAGDNFIAVQRRNIFRDLYTPDQDPVILSIYYYDRENSQINLGGTSQFGDGKGIRKSILKVGANALGIKRCGSQKYTNNNIDCNVVSDYDCENNFSYDVHDWSVSGNRFSVWNRDFDYGFTCLDNHNGHYTGHFAWDGISLRYLHDAFEINSNIQNKIDVYNGHYNLIEHLHSGSGQNTIRMRNLNLPFWESVQMPDITQINHEWVVKPIGDYLVLEKMDPIGRLQAYQGAITNATGATLYKHKNARRAFKIFGNGANDRVEITTGLEYQGLNLGNLMFAGDRLLGVQLWDDGGTFKTQKFVYGKLNPGAINNTSPPQFQFSEVPPVPSSAFYSCQLNGIDLVCTGYDDLGESEGDNRAKLNGKIRFYAEKNGFITTTSTATSVVGFTIRTKGIASNSLDGSEQSFLFDYSGSPVAFNSQSDVPNFSSVAKRNGLMRIRTSYSVDKLSQRQPLMDKTQHGALLEQRVSEGVTAEPNTPTASDRVMSMNYITEKFTTSPEDGSPLKEPAYFLRGLKTSGVEYYFRDSTKQETRMTFFDSLTGGPRITISRVGTRYHVRVTRFVHEFETVRTLPYGRPLQVANFMFNSDPCADTNDPIPADECSNVYRDNLAFLKAPAQKVRATASNIFVYDVLTRTLKETHEWRPSALGVTPLETLEGNLTAGSWRLVNKVVSLVQNNPFTSSPHNQPVVVQSNGLFSSRFYGGMEGRVLASVANADTLYAGFLSGEEELVTASCDGCFGAFGRWGHDATTISAEAVHSGQRALKVTGPYGPTLNLRLGRRAEYLDRKKGFMVSAWIYAKPNSQPSFVVEWRKNTSVSQSDPEGDEVTHIVDLVQDYVIEKGPFPINQWVKVERLIPYDTLMGQGIFTGYPGNEDYLRIWIGKAGFASTADPVFVDDVRLYPADASFSSVNYTLSGQVSSTLDGRNEPAYTVFDAWQNPVAVRRKDGKVFASGAQKQLTE